jgi:hypothetical protein
MTGVEIVGTIGALQKCQFWNGGCFKSFSYLQVNDLTGRTTPRIYPTILPTTTNVNALREVYIVHTQKMHSISTRQRFRVLMTAQFVI